MRLTWPTCEGISYFLTVARFNRLFRAWFQPVRTSWVDCAKAICPTAALFYHYDWWPTILNLSLRSCDGRWSMPGSADGWADGKPGSSIWSWGFSRTHTACGTAGLAGWTSVCDEQAGWTSRLAIQPTGQMNIPYKWTSFRNMLVNISIWLYDHFLRIPKKLLFLESHSNIQLSFFDWRSCCRSRRWEQVPLARRHRHKHVRRQTAAQQSFELAVLTSRRLMSRLCSKKIKKNLLLTPLYSSIQRHAGKRSWCFLIFHFQFTSDMLVTAYCLSNHGDEHACAAGVCALSQSHRVWLIYLS